MSPTIRPIHVPSESYEYETDRLLSRVTWPKQFVTFTKEGGPTPGTGTATLLPDLIRVEGFDGAYHPSVPARDDGRPDWAAYFRAVDGEEQMVYVWRDLRIDAT